MQSAELRVPSAELRVEEGTLKERLKKTFDFFCEIYYWHEVLIVALGLLAIGGCLFYLAWKFLTG